MNNLRIPLDPSLSSHWSPEFRTLWERPEWTFLETSGSHILHHNVKGVRVLCPRCTPEPPSLFNQNNTLADTPVEVHLRPITFVTPGPMGRSYHTVHAGCCPTCSVVVWTMGPHSFDYWTLPQIEALNKTQPRPAPSA